jgi:3-oxoacyl-[acyl-carrier protein] reductase
MRKKKLPARRLGFDLDGRVALVTGGSRGIGAACSELLARAGASVVVNFRTRQSDATRVVRRILKAKGQATAVGADVADPRQAQALIEETVDLYGSLHILVNNAAIWSEGPLLKMSVADWARMMATNLDGVFFTTQAAARHMRRQRSGSIINISSTAGQRGEAFHSHYAASKGAVIALTKSWAAELARHGVRVNCVAPGWVDTEMAAPGLVGSAKKEVLRSIPMGRVGQPEEIAAAVLFLAGEACGFANGEILNVNGGAVLCG